MIEITHIQKNTAILFVFYNKNPFPEEENTASLQDGILHIKKKAQQFAGIYLPNTNNRSILAQIKKLESAYE